VPAEQIGPFCGITSVTNSGASAGSPLLTASGGTSSNQKKRSLQRQLTAARSAEDAAAQHLDDRARGTRKIEFERWAERDRLARRIILPSRRRR
jgi:hypothetical protein